jgi:5'-nucleotidase
MQRILLSNDDGIEAWGIQSLIRAMRKIGHLTVVAPDRERSTASHALTLHRPLRLTEIGNGRYIVDGTPSDCVNIAINWIMKDTPPDLVISGINHGANLGDDIVYSGTAAAAMEATIQGIPAMAVSLVGEPSRRKSFDRASQFAARVAKKVLKGGLPEGTFLNINVPSRINGGSFRYYFTKMGKKYYSQVVEEKQDPRGRKYYWIGGKEGGFRNISKSDCNTVSKGGISVTPLKIDLTDHKYLKRLSSWKF